ncbi:rod shape-determining protein MreD [Xylophilus rhododendri]|uniref:Rod shape-determining protein MreD n=1 Tax=Xylophilus rhododendri TaxID=2697032 RepID=A0A857J5R7_9BURK|nr:rod shape-determining protein MreD [Xylophilus rhododendri]QHI99057.1 rod shape-determining protein MreD [Xylophilus rhododendri]
MARTPQQLLLPVNPVFIWSSLFVALLVALLPLGRAAWVPDVLMLVLVFWSVHQPSRVGMGAAFALGLCVDVQHAALLGQNALIYTVMVYLGVSLQRRLLWFGIPLQAVQLLPLFAGAHVLQTLIRLILGASLPGWGIVAAPLLESLLWIPISVVLLAPQRRAPDRDENRPL